MTEMARRPALRLRKLVAADIPAIDAILKANRRLFPAQERRIAVEMLHETLADADDPYQCVVAVQSGTIAGYACFGSIPLTRGSFDLYWIAVHPDHQGCGIGARLLRRCEREIARQGGRLILIETSGRAVYAPTRGFYERMDYATVARIVDFYKPGDDKFVYVKYIGGPANQRPR
jgi:ribosomal protein S18 acetylase RimI-like enzyme